MAVFDLVSSGWFSRQYSFLQDGSPVAVISGSAWKEEASFRFENREYELAAEGWTGGRFRLSSGSNTLILAERRGWSSSAVDFEYSGKAYCLKPASFWNGSFVLLENGAHVGEVRQEGFLKCRVAISLPDHLPLPVQFFVAWLGIVQWNRDASALAVGG